MDLAQHTPWEMKRYAKAKSIRSASRPCGNRHVEIEGSKIVFQFRGKSGKMHRIDLQDRRLAAIVKRCRELPGYELFQYTDDAGAQGWA